LLGHDGNGHIVIADADNVKTSAASPSKVHGKAAEPKSNVAAELANQMCAHGFCCLLEDNQKHIENSKNEGENLLKHDNTQDLLEKQIVDTLALHGGIDLHKSLGAEMVPHLHDLSEQSPVDFEFHSVVGGKKDTNKHEIMNNCLILCAMKWINQMGKNEGKQHDEAKRICKTHGSTVSCIQRKGS